MSISIYYSAQRDSSLTEIETNLVNTIIQKYSVDKEIKNYATSGSGLNWESFSFYPKTTSNNTVLEGSTKLPDNSADATWIGLQHWCKLLTELKLNIKDANWKVAVNDHKIFWDSTKKEYDPSV